MAKAVVNVRNGRNSERKIVRVFRQNMAEVIDALWDRVLLCAPRDEPLAGYFGTARLTRLELDYQDHRYMIAQLEDEVLFSEPVPLSSAGVAYEADINSAGKLPFAYFSNGIRLIDEGNYHAIVDAAARSPCSANRPGMAEPPQPPIKSTSDVMAAPDLETLKRRKRNAELRGQTIQAYGPECALSGSRHIIMPDMIYEVEVCHNHGLCYGGPDTLRNLIPTTRLSIGPLTITCAALPTTAVFCLAAI